ncbi:MAG: TolC family protein [Pedobacter sp.]
MEKLIAVAKENYPRQKIFAQQVDLAKARLQSEKSSWLDPFSFSYNYRSNTENGNNVDFQTAGILLSGYQFGVTLSPSIFLRNPSNIKAAREDVKIAESSRAEYDLTLESEVKRRYLTYLQAFNVLKLRSKAVIDIESTFKLIKSRYERNEVTFENYNSASIAQLQAHEAKIVAEAASASSKILLEEMLTKKLEEIK